MARNPGIFTSVKTNDP